MRVFSPPFPFLRLLSTPFRPCSRGFFSNPFYSIGQGSSFFKTSLMTGSPQSYHAQHAPLPTYSLLHHKTAKIHFSHSSLSSQHLCTRTLLTTDTSFDGSIALTFSVMSSCGKERKNKRGTVGENEEGKNKGRVWI